MTLYPHQSRAVDALRSAARRWAAVKPGYGLLAVAPTGAGKTRIALELAAAAASKTRRTVWLAPRTELIDQPVERLAECGYTDVRVIKAGRTVGSDDAAITVGSIQALIARGQVPPADLVVLDEARHYVAAEWGKVASAYLGAVRVGLDATPARGDGVGLGDLFDELIEVASVAELTAGGYLVPARVFSPSEPLDDLAWDPVTWWHQEAYGRPTVAFCASKDHARLVADEFWFHGVSAMAVDADTSAPVRAEAVRMLRAGELQVLTNCQVFTEGFDARCVSCIMVCRGVSHEAAWLQMIGRGLRTDAGKVDCIVGDFRGHLHRFGHPEDPRRWSLDGAAVRRVEGLPAVVQCRQCHAWSRGGGTCRHCGAQKPPPPLPKITKREMKERRRREVAERTPQRGAKWEYYCGVVRAARAGGWDGRAVPMRFKARWGHWPAWLPEQVEG